MFPRAQIKEHAKQRFQSYYWMCVGVYIGIAAIITFSTSITLGIGAFVLAPVLIVGYAYYWLCVYRGQKPTFATVFLCGFNDYGRNLGGMLYMFLFTWLWSLLFIIPGIIKALAYSMTPYLLADHPDIRATDAIKISMKITEGRKMDIFVMYLSFIGWWILSALTGGILAIFYTGPYLSTVTAGMYEELKKEALMAGRITPHELERPRY